MTNFTSIEKLLIIAPQNPYPATDGGKIGIYYPIIHLARHFQIHFVFITAQKVDKTAYKHFEEHGINIYPQVTPTKDTIPGYLLNFLSKLPYKFSKYFKNSIYNNIAAIVQQQQITRVWCNHPHVASYAIRLKRQFNLSIYLRAHNIEFALVQQAARVITNPLVKAFVRYQSAKTKQFEVLCWQNFNKVFFITEADLAQAQRLMPGQENFSVLHDSFQKLKPAIDTQIEPKSFLITSPLITFQNTYNLRNFIKTIWLPLVQQWPEYKLYLTGNSNDVLQKALKCNPAQFGIYNLGFVDDLATVIQSKKYFIAPTYIGSGVRIKLLNALQLGSVCLVTPLDEGMLPALEHGKNIISFTDYTSFVDNLSMLEEDEAYYQLVSENAKQVVSQLSWRVYAEQVNDAIA